MKTEELERGNKIQKRLKELEQVQAWIEGDRKLFIIPMDCTGDDLVELSQDARSFLYGMAIGERHKLQEEFDNL